MLLNRVFTLLGVFVVAKTSDAWSSDALKNAVRFKLGQLLGFPDDFTHLNKRQTRGIPDYMRSLYESQHRMLYGEDNEIEKDFSMHHQLLTDASVDTVRSFKLVEKDAESERRAYGEGRARLRFNVSFELFPSHERFLGAELRLFFKKRPSQSETIQVYDIVRPATKKQPDAILRLLDTKTLHPARLPKEINSLGLDITDAVYRWRHDGTNYGLYVKVFVEWENSTAISVAPSVFLRRSCSAQDPQNASVSLQPTLLTFHSTYAPTNAAAVMPLLRSPRAARHHKVHHHRKKNPHRHNQQCKRHTLYIDFNDVGWNDWIVAPPGYHAYYCHGECTFPIPEHLNGTNHAIVQSLVNSVRHRQGAPAPVPKSCCVPTELAPISLLYVDAYDRVVLKNYQEMVVLGCGCR